MEQILSVFMGDDILANPSDAIILRRRVERYLVEGKDAVVVLDFAGVNGVLPGFVDELLSPLFDLLGETLSDRVLLDNCSASVLNDLKCVAETGRPVVPTAPAPSLRSGRHAA